MKKVVVVHQESKRRKPKVHDPLQNVFDNVNRKKDIIFIDLILWIILRKHKEEEAGDDAI